MTNLLYIDLFCGAGGTSTGVESARHKGDKCAKVIACVNHDKNAIASHAANHPDALHFTEDIRTLELSPLVAHIEKMKVEHPAALVVLWASLECTNFSKAKGGKPRDADSRTLAEHLFRYIEAINPDYIQIENVEEFMCWGDLCENGKPISRRKGSSYILWLNKICDYGYNYDYGILNAADFGAYTSRKRYFGIFAKKKRLVSGAELPIVFPKKTHEKNPRKCRDNSHHLFEQPKPLKKWKPVKDVLDFSDEGESIFTRKKPLSDKTLERIYAGLIKFVAGGKDKFLSLYYSGHPESKNKTIDEPAHTVTAIDHHSLVSTASFLGVYCGKKQEQNSNAISVENPAPTITVWDRISVINPKFLMSNYSNGHNCSSVEKPCGTIVNNPKQNLVSCKSGQYSPLSGELEGASPMHRIKEFMALYGIADIKMRMLKIPELKRIMGFPTDYTLIGTQAEQKKYIGNAVEVTVARVLCEALVAELYVKAIKHFWNNEQRTKTKNAGKGTRSCKAQNIYI